MSDKKNQKLSMKRLAAMAGVVIALGGVGAGLFVLNTARSMNAELRETTDALRTRVENIDWNNPETLSSDLDALDALRTQVEKLEEWKVHGPPAAMGWGMYAGDELLEPAAAAYLKAVTTGLIEPAKAQLEKTLNARQLNDQRGAYAALKTYVLFSDPARLSEHDDYFAFRVIEASLAHKGATDHAEAAVLRHKMAGHVMFYAHQAAMQAAEPLPVDAHLLDTARMRISSLRNGSRYYDALITVLEDEKIDPVGPSTVDNLKFPPVSLEDLFAKRPKVLEALKSKKARRGGKPEVVRGPYTTAGRAQVMKAADASRKRLRTERWVIPLQKGETTGKIERGIDRALQDYEAQYLREWVSFFEDIHVSPPESDAERAALFELLVTPDAPYGVLLATLKKNAEERANKLAEVAAFSGLPAYLDALRSAAATHESGGTMDLAPIEKLAQEQLLTLGDTGKRMLTPLLLGPLKKS